MLAYSGVAVGVSKASGPLPLQLYQVVVFLVLEPPLTPAPGKTRLPLEHQAVYATARLTSGLFTLWHLPMQPPLQVNNVGYDYLSNLTE